MMRPRVAVLNGIASSSDYTDDIAYVETSIAGRRWCSGAVDYRAEVPYQSEINIEDNPDTPEDESANNRPERQRVPEVAGVRPACEKPTAWLPLEITEAGDYYLAVSTAWSLPRDRWSIRTTGELNIEQFTQSAQPSISSVSVSDITRTSAKFTVVVSNSWGEQSLRQDRQRKRVYSISLQADQRRRGRAVGHPGVRYNCEKR